MPRLLALLAITLFAATASAQSADLEALFSDEIMAEAAEYGVTVLEGPTFGTSSSAMTHEFDLEAGGQYVLIVGCTEDSGLDPEVVITDPSGGTVETAPDDSHGESIPLLATESGTYSVDVTLLGCTGECEYGVLLAQM